MSTELVEGIIFKAEMTKIGLAMRIIAEIDLDALTRTVSMAHTIGPFIDPTAYMNALDKGDMDAMAELAESLKKPVKIWNEKIVPKLKDE